MTVRHIVVHCSATPPSMDIGADEIRQWHLARGFDDIGYNYVVRRGGTVEAGRPEGAVLAHAKGYNTESIAICLVGGVNEHGVPAANFTQAQAETLNPFIAWMERRYPSASIIGHRDLPGVLKDCPSFSVGQFRATGTFAQPRKIV